MWGKNVRAVISKENWDALRWGLGATKTKPPFIKLEVPFPDWNVPIECSICNAKEDNLELHEQWEYDDKQLIQKLIGLVSICSNCHLAAHLGRAKQLGFGDKAINHLAKVNQWTTEQVTQHVKTAFKI
jgi:5-methylcytosine-specific restriction endonuclease McrA